MSCCLFPEITSLYFSFDGNNYLVDHCGPNNGNNYLVDHSCSKELYEFL